MPSIFSKNNRIKNEIIGRRKTEKYTNIEIKHHIFEQPIGPMKKIKVKLENILKQTKS